MAEAEAPTIQRSDVDRDIDVLTAKLQQDVASLIECPVAHRFTPGLYAREIFMPAGAVVISRVHKTEHPFVVLEGHASVLVYDGGVAKVEEIVAPFVGITRPGTRRVLVIRKDCRWITFHPTPETDVDKIQEQITDTPDVSYVSEDPVLKLYLEGKL